MLTVLISRRRSWLVFGLGMIAIVNLKPVGAAEVGVRAVPNQAFLSSLGINTHVSQGYDPVSYIKPLRYLGVPNIRDSERNLPGLILLHNTTGVKVDLLIDNLDGLTVARRLARADALLAIEGPNEPNNFEISYRGKKGGGSNGSWLPVAELQRDIYNAVKNDPELEHYPVFHVSEGGAATENVGLHFLVIPDGASTLMPDGTRYADYANVHNYVSGNNAGYVDNQAWQASDPILDSRWDGLYGEYGRTWRKHFRGYSNAELETLPRVTTETGWNAVSFAEERIQGTVLTNTYLAQFKRGWKYTFIYQLGEGEGGGGDQGLFHQDWTPKLAATYIHNLTSILKEGVHPSIPEKLDYTISDLPETGHDLLLQKAGGVFDLVVWGERVRGESKVNVSLGRRHALANIYDVTIGTKPIQTLRDVTNIPLVISDHALIIEIFEREALSESR